MNKGNGISPFQHLIIPPSLEPYKEFLQDLNEIYDIDHYTAESHTIHEIALDILSQLNTSQEQLELMNFVYEKNKAVIHLLKERLEQAPPPPEPPETTGWFEYGVQAIADLWSSTMGTPKVDNLAGIDKLQRLNQELEELAIGVLNHPEGDNPSLNDELQTHEETLPQDTPTSPAEETSSYSITDFAQKTGSTLAEAAMWVVVGGGAIAQIAFEAAGAVAKAGLNKAAAEQLGHLASRISPEKVIPSYEKHKLYNLASLIEHSGSKVGWTTHLINLDRDVTLPLRANLEQLVAEGNFEELIGTALEALVEGVEATRHAPDAAHVVQTLTADPKMTVETYRKETQLHIKNSMIRFFKNTQLSEEEKVKAADGVFEYFKRLYEQLINKIVAHVVGKSTAGKLLKRLQNKSPEEIKALVKNEYPALYDILEEAGTWKTLDKFTDHADLLFLYLMEKTLQKSTEILDRDPPNPEQINLQKLNFKDAFHRFLDQCPQWIAPEEGLTQTLAGLASNHLVKHLDVQASFIDPLRDSWRKWIQEY